MNQDATGTRRTFVKFASAAIASAAVPIRGANDRVNIGIVGLGGRGNDHIEYFTSLSSECRIAAICDVNQAARERAQAHIVKLGGRAGQRIYRHARPVRVEGHRRRHASFAQSLARPGHHLGLPGGQRRVCGEARQPQHFRIASNGEGGAQIQSHGPGGQPEPLHHAQDQGDAVVA